MSQQLREKLEREVIAELADERFINLTHERSSTYDEGCRGPLCKKRTRDRGRETYAEMMGGVKPYSPRPKTVLTDKYLEEIKLQLGVEV